VKGEPDNEFAHIYRDLPMDSIPREGVGKELIDWIMLRHDKLPQEDKEFYRSLPRLLNDLPTLRNYFSQMSIVDDGVDRVLRQLEESGQTGDTIVIYTADHGMSLGQHGFWGHGEDTWPSNTHREAHNIPLIVSGPCDLVSGSVESSLVGTTDIFATILDYTGLEPLSGEDISGRSLRPLLKGGNSGWEQEVYMEQEETRSIRTSKWLFMKRFAPTSFEFENLLYDLQDDPGERHNLATDVKFQNTVTELNVKIDSFFSRYADPKWDLWNGGAVKSNSSRPFLWQEVWGDHWKPSF